MIRVRVDGDGDRDISIALRKLKKLIEKDGLMKEIKKHEYYEKPSEKRRRAAVRRLKMIRKAQEEAREKQGF
jgi:small subunit ribosomal protein S21